MNYETDILQTLNPDGSPPETRMKDALSTQDFCTRLIAADIKRSYVRSRVDGIVGGNPPFQASKLRQAGRAEAANFNTGTARAYMESGTGAFYDLFSETPGYFGVRISYGTEEQKEMWEGIMRMEADRVLSNDPVFDYNMQQSQWDMVLHGCGPLMFEDAYMVLPKAFRCGDLYVPEFTPSDTYYWDGAAIASTYYPPQLYKFIENEDAAEAVGWDVEYTKRVIEQAMNIRTESGILYNWEFYQQELKNNSACYYDTSKVSRIMHVFWKEFDGRITHVMVPQNTSSGVTTQYLFQSIGRYADWRQTIHPMYYDRGNGGDHHSVTGLGVKMFSMMKSHDRLANNAFDKAVAPKIMFKPTSTEASQKFSLAHFGDYAVMPAGFDWQQTGLAGLNNEVLAMKRELNDMLQSNLSAYRQQVPMKQEGNPITAKQVMFDASQQSSLSKTTFNRYYKQLDLLYTEIMRRLCNFNSTDDRAKEFQERCKRKGVPKEALGRVEKVEAIRVIGQGSAFMRRQAVDSLMPYAAALPENGRDNLIADKIAAEAGQSAVARYYPTRATDQMATEQNERANNQVAGMKVGVPPIVDASQSSLIFAQTFLNAGAQAMGSLQQGANPAQVLGFLELAGPGARAHLNRMQNDPTREPLYKALDAQWQKMAALTDKLRQQLQQQAQAQNGQAAKTQAAMTDQQIAQAKASSDIAIKTQKSRAQMAQSQERHQIKTRQQIQDMALADARTASEIALSKQRADAESSTEE